MRYQGIFGAFGETPAAPATLAGQKLALAPNPGVINPLATAAQSSLSKMGTPKLAVDGKWGDCSQKAWINLVGTPPTPGGVVDMFGLDKFGVTPQNVTTWSQKSPYCTDGSDEVNLDSATPTFAPAIAVAKTFGLPIPAGICNSFGANRVADPTTGTCICAAGTSADGSGNCVGTPTTVGYSSLLRNLTTPQANFQAQFTPTVRTVALPKATVTSPINAAIQSFDKTKLVSAVQPGVINNKTVLAALFGKAGGTGVASSGHTLVMLAVLGAVGVGGYLLYKRMHKAVQSPDNMMDAVLTEATARSNRRRRRHSRRRSRRRAR